MSDGPYSRLYHRFAEEFKDIYNDDRALAAWVRLLVVADAAWPVRPPLPRSLKPAQMSRLIQAGVLIVQRDDYTILGLDAERTRRRDSGRIGAAKRWQSDGNAKADAIAMPRRDETSKDEITPPPQAGRRKDGTNPRSLGTNPRANGTSPRQERAAQKRSGLPLSVHQILARAASEGHS